MRSLTQFLIEPVNGELYDNKVNIAGKEVFLSTSIEGHETTNRFATVISTPAGYNGLITKGDTVIVHHNVFRKVNDIRGKEVFSSGLLKDDVYMADDVEVFAYNKGKEWIGVDPYLFVQPIRSEDMLAIKGEIELHGLLKIGNDFTNRCKIAKDDIVCFRPDSEYEFTVDGEKLYRINSNNVCLTI